MDLPLISFFSMYLYNDEDRAWLLCIIDLLLRVACTRQHVYINVFVLFNTLFSLESKTTKRLSTI